MARQRTPLRPALMVKMTNVRSTETDAADAGPVLGQECSHVHLLAASQGRVKESRR
jgi:hypothetical protein